MAFLNGYNFHPTIRPALSNMTTENVGYKVGLVYIGLCFHGHSQQIV